MELILLASLEFLLSFSYEGAMVFLRMDWMLVIEFVHRLLKTDEYPSK